jgi:glutathionylspermidine synthase
MKNPWQNINSLPAQTFKALRREAIFHCCKWDPQVGDVSVLSPVPLVLELGEWQSLVEQTEALAAETIAAENELLTRPDLHAELGLDRNIRKCLLNSAVPSVVNHPRLMRFDFHFTTEGWRISEVNSDVPGGFNEAAGFSRLMASHYPGLTMAGDPSQALAQALVGSTAKSSPTIGLVHATAYTDDRQVMVYLGQELKKLGAHVVFLGPDHLEWKNGFPFVKAEWSQSPLDAVFRFFPAEWLPNLPSRCHWQNFFAGSKVPLCNPGAALLTQSKRFSLVWHRLQTPLPTWRNLLPETYAPSSRFRPEDPAWVFKPAMGRVGSSIGMAGVTTKKDWQQIKRSLWWYRREWVVQKRFEVIPILAKDGPFYPCLGIYTVNGRAAGAYGRVSRDPLINHLAMDAAVLLQPAAVMTPKLSEPPIYVAA